MSIKATKWAWSQELSLSLKLVLLHFADRHCEKDGRCNPGHHDGMARTGLCDGALRTAVRKLEDLGLIKREKRVAQHGRQTSNQYVLLMPGEVAATCHPPMPGEVAAGCQGGWQLHATLEPSSEPEGEQGLSLREADLSPSSEVVPLPTGWQPDAATMALAAERGIHEGLGPLMQRFCAYYSPGGERAHIRLTAAGWQAKAQYWLSIQGQPGRGKSERSVPRARAQSGGDPGDPGGVAAWYKKIPEPGWTLEAYQRVFTATGLDASWRGSLAPIDDWAERFGADKCCSAIHEALGKGIVPNSPAVFVKFVDKRGGPRLNKDGVLVEPGPNGELLRVHGL